MEGGKAAASSAAKLLGGNIMRLVESIESADPAELSRELFGDDQESLQKVTRAFPSIVNTAVQVCKGFAEALERLPADAGARMMAGSLSEISGAGIGDAVNSLSRVLIQFYERDPDLFNRSKLETTSDAIKAIDYGKLRKSLTYKARVQMEYRREAVVLIGEEPIALINLISLIPEYVNDTLKLLNQVLDSIGFPPEAMTYAVFKILEEIDWEELSGAVNGVSRFINTLQKGDLLLGDGSSEFTGVISSVSEDFTQNVDFIEVSRAVSALSEYMEAAATSLATGALEKEGGALAISGALLSISNSAIRSMSAILERATALHPETLGAMAGGLKDNFSARELGAAFNSALVLFNRFTAGDPELAGTIIGNALSGVDSEQAGLAASTLTAEFVRAVLGGTAAGKPELGVLGIVVNNTLASYNQLSAEDPQVIARSLDVFLASLDEDQVNKAAKSAASQVADAALRNPGVTRAVVRALLSATFKFVKGYIGNLVGKRERGVT
ncbi:MAG: hypothetical protein KKF66_00340 [Actinobacteria bacterium]|nr:hypothetical protein [Actinomycetota bacterium]